jgi:hypothetical protein
LRNHGTTFTPPQKHSKKSLDNGHPPRIFLIAGLGAVGVYALFLIVTVTVVLGTRRAVTAPGERVSAEAIGEVPQAIPVEPPPGRVPAAVTPMSSVPEESPPSLPEADSAEMKTDYESNSPAVEIKPAVAKPAPPQAKPAPVPQFVLKRMHDRSSQDVLWQISGAPSLTLDKSAVRLESIAVIRARAADLTNTDVTPTLLSRRADLAGLPLVRGSAARLDPNAIRHLALGARELQNKAAGPLLEADLIWLRPERIPALMQVLMAESDDARMTLARHLGRIPGQRAADALVQVALFDPEPNVRRAAVAALNARPADEYRVLLMRGFNYPSPIAAENAAEALVTLKRVEVVPRLVTVLEGPDPQAPYAGPNEPLRHVKELVRIRHKLNCLMCHPASFHAHDPLRREVPSLKEVAGRASFGYGLAGLPPEKHAFVRADVTYLRQDYSVRINGDRYDLFVRERLSTPADELAAQNRRNAGLTPHQMAAAFALRELTGVVPGPNFVNWLQAAGKVKAAMK